MSLRSSLNLPREHGAWAMLYAPFVLGILAAGRFNLQALLLLLATTAIFISRESLLAWSRARKRGKDASRAGRLLAGWLSLAAIAGAPLITVWSFYLLIPLGAIGVALLLINGRQGAQFEERSIGGELLAICGLTLTAPASFYVARGAWDKTALWLWLLSALYFASSVFYVKLRIYSLNPRKEAERRRVRLSCAYYHSFLLAGLAALYIFGSLPLFVLIAFAPALARTFWSILKPAKQINLKRAGILEIVYSLVFLICLALSFRAA